MVTWLMLLCFLPQQIDEAKARMEIERSKLLFNKAVAEIKQPVTYTLLEIEDEIVTSSSIQIVTTNYLVSEPWCVNCPPAKAKFIAEGNPPENIINIATAQAVYKKSVSGVPYRFSIKNPKSYRSEWPPVINVEGDTNPSKSKLLNHLRFNKNHQNKAWQEWFLESWKLEQLTALHSDDHQGKSLLSTSTALEKNVEITIDSPPNLSYTAQILFECLSQQVDKEYTYRGFLDFEVDTPDILPQMIDQLMVKK